MTSPIHDYDLRQNPYKVHHGVKRVWLACGHSLQGLAFAVREESAFRQELAIALLMVPWAFAYSFSSVERLVLIGSLMLVLVVELINSGIEAAVDRISFETHSLSKRAKDYGSAAVLLALVFCSAVWATIFYPIFFS